MVAQNCGNHYKKVAINLVMYDSAKEFFPTASGLPWNPKEIGDFTISLLE